jgi:hypothetical protein
MKTKIKTLLTVFSIAFFFVLAIASNTMKHLTYTIEGGQIPPDFSNTKDTLLVISRTNDYISYNRYLKKNFKENYTKNYKLISPEELNNYPVDKYRYSFDHTVNHTTQRTVTTTNMGNGISHTSSNSSTQASSDIFYVTDRKSGINYKTGSSAYFSKLMKQYIQALDATR